MAELSELPLATRVLLRTYPWRRVSPTPWTPLRKPIHECRVALVSSAGATLPGQPDFDHAISGGDPSFRLIPAEAEVASLRDRHRSAAFDHAGVQADPNLGFPLDRLRELAARGRIRDVAPRHLSCMGSLTKTGRLVRDTAPAAAQVLVDDAVDVALLVPI